MLNHTSGSRPANLTLLSLATIAALAFASCADGVDDYAQDKNEDGTIGSDVPGSNGSGNNNSGNNNSGNKGDDNGSGNTSPNKPGSKCQETLRRCNDKGNVEVCTGGVYVEDPCDGTCFKGECTKFNDNSCENPLVVAPGDKKSLSTNTRNDFAVSNTYSACKNIHNRLAVAKLTIPKFGYYEITVTSAQDVPNWGVFESLSCTADDFYQNSCLSTGEQKSRTMTRLLSPGDFYVFVGGINAKTAPPPFDATIELKQLDAPKAVACNYKGKVTPSTPPKAPTPTKTKRRPASHKPKAITAANAQTPRPAKKSPTPSNSLKRKPSSPKSKSRAKTANHAAQTSKTNAPRRRYTSKNAPTNPLSAHATTPSNAPYSPNPPTRSHSKSKSPQASTSYSSTPTRRAIATPTISL